MATIVKRGNNYQAKVRVKGFPTVTKSFKTEDEAQAWADKTYVAMRNDTFVQELPSLQAALKTYKEQITPRKRSAHTEVYVIEKVRQEKFMRKALNEIKVTDIVDWRNRMTGEYAPSTIKKRISLVSAVYRVARSEWGFGSLENPCDGVLKPAVDNARNRLITDYEYAAVLRQLKTEELQAAVRLARSSSMRLGEVISLQWKNIDFNRCLIFLEHTKNGDARTVPLSPASISALKILHNDDVTPSMKLFDLNKDRLSKGWTRAVDRARRDYIAECKKGGKRVDQDMFMNMHFHDLRHTAITEFAEAGFSTLELSRISGHKTLSMLDRYVHLDVENIAKKLAVISGS